MNEVKVFLVMAYITRMTGLIAGAYLLALGVDWWQALILAALPFVFGGSATSKDDDKEKPAK